MTEYKYSTQLVSELLRNNGYNLMKGQEYISIKDKMKITDSEGYGYYISLDCFLYNTKSGGDGFHKFFTGNIFVLENIKLWLIENNKTFSFVSGEYLGARVKNLVFSCNNCGNEWNTSWNDISRNHGCPICSVLSRSQKRKIPLEDVLKVFEKNNVLIMDPNKYIDTENKILCKCKKCNHEWETDYHHVKNGKTCPKCDSSHGEKKVQRFLEDKVFLIKFKKDLTGAFIKNGCHSIFIYLNIMFV